MLIDKHMPEQFLIVVSFQKNKNKNSIKLKLLLQLIVLLKSGTN